jgi:hypothetical protein
MTIVLTIHSLIRWIIMLVALALIVRLSIGLVKKQPFDKIAAGLTSAFAGLMDTQMLLGGLFFLVSGFGGTGFPTYRWEHAISMLLAIVTAHLPRVWKKAEDGVRTRHTLLAVVISLLLVFLGIVPIGGWTRWWHITGLF